MSGAGLLNLDLTPRQAELADAVLAVVAREGLPALSFRVVAVEACCSVGSVQKAFPTKDRMIAAAFARLRQTAVVLPDGEPGRPTLHAWLVELAVCILPLDEPRAAAQRQGDTFAIVAATDSAIAGAIAASDEHLRGLFAALIGRAQHEGELSAELDPGHAAWGILALLQGAATQMSYQQTSENDARLLVGKALARLLAL